MQLLKKSFLMEWSTVFDGLAGSSRDGKTGRKCALHKGPPQLLQGARASAAYMRTCWNHPLFLAAVEWRRGA